MKLTKIYLLPNHGSQVNLKSEKKLQLHRNLLDL